MPQWTVAGLVLTNSIFCAFLSSTERPTSNVYVRLAGWACKRHTRCLQAEEEQRVCKKAEQAAGRRLALLMKNDAEATCKQHLIQGTCSPHLTSPWPSGKLVAGTLHAIPCCCASACGLLARCRKHVWCVPDCMQLQMGCARQSPQLHCVVSRW